MAQGAKRSNEFPEMLDSFEVRNFRLFRHLSVPRLSRVNLFVGRNNSGKSALLEAIEAYGSNASLDVLLDLVLVRDGNWESEITDAARSILETTETTENPLRSLFYGHHLPEVGAEGIQIGPIGRNGKITIRTQAYQIVHEEDVTRRIPVSRESLKKLDLVDVQVGIEVQEGSRSSYLASTAVDAYFMRRRRPSGPSREPKWVFEMVPAHNLTDAKVAALWDRVHLTDLENEVVSCLRLIQPSLVGVAFVGESSAQRPGIPPRTRRVPIVRLSEAQDRLPLKSMGDGIARLFQIALALVNSRDGALLIDEFENGLHWSVQPKVWDFIFRLSQDLNVQVFATTHSRDCIQAFASVWQGNGDLATFYRLDTDVTTGTRAVAYNRETLFDAIETEVEVR